MKKLVAILFALISLPAFAGLTYNFQSDTKGVQNSRLAGNVAVEGTNMRLNITTGDGVLFRDNSFALAKNGGKTISVVDPSTKTFYELHLDDLLGGGGAALKQLGDMVKFSINNPQLSVRDGGDGGEIEGYPTRRRFVDGAYDINVDAMGQKMTMKMTMKTELWTTDRLGSEYVTFLQMRGVRSGIEAFDKLVDANAAAMKGFPLKQVTTVHVSQNAMEMTTTTTTTISAIASRDVPATEFAIPAGYAKTESPIEKLLGALKGRQ